MLTPNFSKIISVILEQSRNNTLEQRSAEELRSIGLMLLGYLRLINTEFSTSADTSEPHEGYYEDLKGVLNLITTTQTKRLNIIKKQLMDEFYANGRGIIKKINELETQSLLDKHHKNTKIMHTIGLLKKSLEDLMLRIEQTMRIPHTGLLEATRCLIHEQESLFEQIKRIKPCNSTQLLAQVHHLIQETIMHHVTSWTQWIEIEENNQQCITYGSCNELIGLCV